MKKAILVTSLAICVGAVFAFYFGITASQRQLDAFLKRVSQVEIGKTKFEDWRKEFQQAPISNVVFGGDQQTASISWRGQNKTLYKLRLAPLSTIQATVEFKNGTASDIYIWTEINDALDANGAALAGTGATVHQIIEAPSCSENYSTFIKQNGSHRWVTITMDHCISQAARLKAFAVDSSCLSRIGGCKTAEAIVPAVFNER
jgi:hypothetical protein